MGIALLDSSTVIGFLDADDVLHRAADAAVRAAAEHAFAVSVVTVAELLTGAKLGHHDERTVGVDVRPEQLRQAAAVIGGQAVGPLGFLQDVLDEDRVDVDQGRLRPVHGAHRDLLGLTVGAREL